MTSLVFVVAVSLLIATRVQADALKPNPKYDGCHRRDASMSNGHTSVHDLWNSPEFTPNNGADFNARLVGDGLAAHSVSPLKISTQFAESFSCGDNTDSVPGEHLGVKGNVNCKDNRVNAARWTLIKANVNNAVAEVSNFLKVRLGNTNESSVVLPTATANCYAWDLPFDAAAARNAHTVVIVTVTPHATASGNSAIAWARPCYFSTATKRPVVVHLNVASNAGLWSPLSTEEPYQRRAILGELLRALGFSQYQVKNWISWAADGKSATPQTNVVVSKVESRYGNPLVRYITTPSAVSRAASYFGCSTLPGIELENWEDEKGVVHSNGNNYVRHNYRSSLEKRVYLRDVLAPNLNANPKVTVATLAVMEATGWYAPVYEAAEEPNWGGGQGCAFATGHCALWKGAQSCATTHLSIITSKNKPGVYAYHACSVDGESISRCNYGNIPGGVSIGNNSIVALGKASGLSSTDLDKLHQSTNNVQGQDFFADYCFLSLPCLAQDVCTDTTSTRNGQNGDKQNCKGELCEPFSMAGPTSKCFYGNLQYEKQRAAGTITAPVRCLPTQCSFVGGEKQLTIQVGKSTATCTASTPIALIDGQPAFSNPALFNYPINPFNLVGNRSIVCPELTLSYCPALIPVKRYLAWGAVPILAAGEPAIFTVRVVDANGAAVPLGTYPVSIRIATSADNLLLGWDSAFSSSGTKGKDSVFTVEGNATLTTYTDTSRDGTITFYASYLYTSRLRLIAFGAGFENSVTTDVTVVPGPAVKLLYLAVPEKARVGETFTTQVGAADKYDNLVQHIDVSTGCDEGWTYIDGLCFSPVQSSTATKDAARSQCSALYNGFLPGFSSDKQLDYIASQALLVEVGIWVGLGKTLSGETFTFSWEGSAFDSTFINTSPRVRLGGIGATNYKDLNVDYIVAGAFKTSVNVDGLADPLVQVSFICAAYPSLAVVQTVEYGYVFQPSLDPHPAGTVNILFTSSLVGRTGIVTITAATNNGLLTPAQAFIKLYAGRPAQFKLSHISATFPAVDNRRPRASVDETFTLIVNLVDIVGNVVEFSGSVSVYAYVSQ